MSRTIRVFALLAALALVSVGLSAQAPGQAGAQVPAKPGSGSAVTGQVAAPAQGSAQQQAPPQQPTFRVAIDLVTTDVIVRDPKGVFVADLKKDDFEVLEDGVKQDIVSMELVHGGRVYTQLVAPPPPIEEGIILPSTRPTNDAAGRIFIFFVDDLHLEFRNSGRIKELFKKMANLLVHDGDMFGIISTGPSSLAIDLTYDRRRLDEAIKRISGAGLKPSDIIGSPESPEGPPEVRYRAHVAFSTASDLMRNLEQVKNRRKSLIYVSDGYDFNPFTVSRYGDDPFWGGQQEQNKTGNDVATNTATSDAQQQGQDPLTQARQGQQFLDADLARELGQLTRDANRANVSIYTIDPRGLVAGADLDETIDPTEWMDYVKKSQDSLRVLAEETGGIAVVNQNDFDKALKRIDNETSDYYVLGYYSSNPDPLKRTRQIDVKVVNHEGLTVWSRKLYSLKRPQVK